MSTTEIAQFFLVMASVAAFALTIGWCIAEGLAWITARRVKKTYRKALGMLGMTVRAVRLPGAERSESMIEGEMKDVSENGCRLGATFVPFRDYTIEQVMRAMGEE